MPAYLTIQFVRFYYKEKEAINAKILKDVKFPLEFDVFELCSSELQTKLTPMREKFKEYEDRLVEESRNIINRKDKTESKKKVKQEPFSFPDGNKVIQRLEINRKLICLYCHIYCCNYRYRIK